MIATREFFRAKSGKGGWGRKKESLHKQKLYIKGERTSSTSLTE